MTISPSLWTGSLALEYSKCFLPTPQGLQVGLVAGGVGQGAFSPSLLSPENADPFVAVAVSFINAAQDDYAVLEPNTLLRYVTLPDQRKPGHWEHFLAAGTAMYYPSGGVTVAQRIRLDKLSYSTGREKERIQVAGNSRLDLPVYGISFSGEEGVRRLCGHLGLSEASYPLRIGVKILQGLGLSTDDPVDCAIVEEEEGLEFKIEYSKRQANGRGYRMSVGGLYPETRSVSLCIQPRVLSQPGLNGPELDLWNLAKAI